MRADFLKTLGRGDLTYVTTHSSEKAHIARLTRSRDEDYAGQPEKLKDYEPLTMWSGDALCGLTPRYYYHPRTEPGDTSERCARCWQRWRVEGKPVIRTSASPAPSSAWPLPFAWREVDLVGHPWDVPPGEPVDGVLDKEGNVCGVNRTERRRWQRGDRVVRVAEYHGEESRGFGVLYHHAKKPLGEKTSRFGSLSDCVQRAWEIMAMGGQP